MKNLNQLGNIKVCSQIVLKCLYLARIGTPDILWSVNKLARAVTKWTQACDRRLARLISYIHHTNDFRLYCYAGNTAQHCRFGLFQDSDFAGDLEDSKSTSGGMSPSVGCARSVSHSSRETEIISLDAGLRKDGLPSLDLWDVVIAVLRSINNTARQGRQAQGNLCGTRDHSINKSKTKTPTEKSKRDGEQLSNVDYVPANTLSSQGES